MRSPTLGEIESSLLRHRLFGDSDSLARRSTAVLGAALHGLATEAGADVPLPVAAGAKAPLAAACVLHRLGPEARLRPKKLLQQISASSKLSVGGRRSGVPIVAIWGEHLAGWSDVFLATGLPTEPCTVGSDEAVAALAQSRAYLNAASPALSRDALDHVRMVIVTGDTNIASASHLLAPSTVTLSANRLGEVRGLAELLLHEALHQKLFALYLTTRIFNNRAPWEAAPAFRPPWHVSRSTRWPIDQALAALHVYTHLVPFSLAELGALEDHAPAVRTLVRARLLGRWLECVGRPFLGEDGCNLVDWLAQSLPDSRAVHRVATQYSIGDLTTRRLPTAVPPPVECGAECLEQDGNPRPGDPSIRYCLRHQDVVIAPSRGADLVSVRFVLGLAGTR